MKSDIWFHFQYTASFKITFFFRKKPACFSWHSLDDEPRKFQITIKPAAEKTTSNLDDFRSIQLTLPTPSTWVSNIACLVLIYSYILYYLHQKIYDQSKMEQLNQ